jgi:hypothetical protein
MERFEYKGYRVEIFITKKGAGWTWTLIVNGTKTKKNLRESCQSPREAMRVAITQACRFIDVDS